MLSGFALAKKSRAIASERYMCKFEGAISGTLAFPCVSLAMSLFPVLFSPPLPPLPRRACELRAAAASRQVALAAAKFARLWILDWTLVS